jgi:hypothetical protein
MPLRTETVPGPVRALALLQHVCGSDKKAVAQIRATACENLTQLTNYLALAL